MTEIGAFSTITAMLFLVAVLPIWPMTRDWGYRPAMVLCGIAAILIVLVFRRII